MSKRKALDLPKPITAKDIMNGYRAQALALSQEKRQEFLDLLWSGKTIGEATRTCGITFEQSMGIMDLNLQKLSHWQLNKESA